jgi:hypothetical protein
MLWLMTTFSLGIIHRWQDVRGWWIGRCSRPSHEPEVRHGGRHLDTSDPSTGSILRVVNHHPSTYDIPTLVLFRSEAEQVVEHELIKSLSDFKQVMVAPSPPHTQQFTSSVKKSIVERLIVTQNFSHHTRTKVNFQKSIVKIARDMLTKK